jgi:hypothetical protein
MIEGAALAEAGDRHISFLRTKYAPQVESTSAAAVS